MHQSARLRRPLYVVCLLLRGSFRSATRTKLLLALPPAVGCILPALVEAFRYALAISGHLACACVHRADCPARAVYRAEPEPSAEGIDQLGPDWLKQHPEALEIIARSLLMGVAG